MGDRKFTWIKDIEGMRSGKLVAVRYLFTNKHRAAVWECLCDCGNKKEVRSGVIVSGGIKSCGCYDRSTNPYKSMREYEIWRSMKRRCCSINFRHYKHYGGRGITVCEEWKLFQNFFSDMGYCPSKRHSLDRIDNNKGYYKENCRWATWKEQNRNKNNNRVIVHNGEQRCLSEWAEIKSINPVTLHSRLERGWGVEKALNATLGNSNAPELETNAG